MEHVPGIVTRRFRSEIARPRVIEEYDPLRGWAESKSRPLLDFGTVEELHARGVTLIRAKWRFNSQEFSVPRLREQH